MALDFPSSPTIGQTYSASGGTWIYNGNSWVNINTLTAADIVNILGYTPVPTSRTLSINGTAFDLSANRSWTINASQWTTSGSNIFYNTGNVGIGTSTPNSATNYSTLSVNGSSGGQITWQTGGSLIGYAYNTVNGLVLGANTDKILVFDAGATERMRITSGGNVGIGTSSPNYKFEVSDGTRTGVFNPNSVLDGFFIGTLQSKPLIFGTGDTERMRITSAGNVGIGTTSPVTRLHIVDTVNTFTGSFSGGASGNLVAIGTALNVPSINGYTSGFASTANLSLQPNGGNVGIGTTDVFAPLVVFRSNSGGLGGNIVINNNGSAVGNETALIFGDGGAANLRAAISSTTEDLPYRGDIKFKTGVGAYSSLTTRMIIKGDGSVGIGTTSPATRLHVQGDVFVSSSVQSTAYFLSNSGSGSGLTVSSDNILLYNWGNSGLLFGTNGNERMRITSAGVVCIGATAPTASSDVRLYVKGNGNPALITSDNNSLALGLGYQGTFHGYLGGISSALYAYSTNGGYVLLNSSSVWVSASDAKRKRNFEPYSLGLDAITALQPKLYNMDFQEDGDDKQVGLVAQEVKDFIPHAYEDNEDFIGLNYNAIIVTMVNAIKELKAEIDQLKNNK